MVLPKNAADKLDGEKYNQDHTNVLDELQQERGAVV